MKTYNNQDTRYKLQTMSKFQFNNESKNSLFGYWKLVIVWLLFLVTCILPPLMAGQYDLKEMTPEVQAALNNRKTRYETLQTLKANNAVTENKSGYVEAAGGDAQTQAIIAQENADRRTIYQAIVDQNNLGSGGLAAVEKAFAEIRQEKEH